jgi:four helix bundle protein
VDEAQSKPEQLRDRTKGFALRVIRLFRHLPKSAEAQIIGKQLLRSATSVAANYRAACRAKSRADFACKIATVLEESDESVFWVELLMEGNIVPAEKLDNLLSESRALTAIFTASRNTSRART